MSGIKKVLEKQREYFNSGKTRPVSFRIEQLKRLKKAVTDNEKHIMEALQKDLNKAPFEAYATEVGMVLEEINYAIKHLPVWVKPKKVKTPVMHFPSTSYTVADPYGVVLVISPWNYPFQLSIAPLVGAIAGGNCAVIKPSEFSFHTSAFLAQLVRDYFGEEFLTVIEGDQETSQALLAERFDYIFFTGSVKVGKVVMAAAAKNLTPLTLELGGKSPCIVAGDADVELAAKRIVWGKFLNAGQTCVAPDYLMVHKDIKNQLIARMHQYIRQFYGEDPSNNEEFPKIINQNHFLRLIHLMQSGTIVAGGEVNQARMCIAPTIIDYVSWDDPIMQEEIFGPLLPVLEFNDLEEVIAVVNRHSKPLALYLFTNCPGNEREIIERVSFGGGCINDTIVHLATSYMPFGGVGESGMGKYHGKASFETFTHTKSILKKYLYIDIPLRYPPYRNNLALVKRFLGR